MSIKEEVYQQFKQTFEAESSGATGIRASELYGLLTYRIFIPEGYDLVILDAKFREFVEYGHKLSVVRGFLEEKKSYYKFVFDNYKERMKIVYKDFSNNRISEEKKNEFDQDYDKVCQEYLAWQFFHKLANDKWNLLDIHFDQIRTCISTVRETIKRGIADG